MGKKAPDPPDLSASAQASERAAELAYQSSAEQLQWAKDMWGEQKDLLQQVLGPQLDIMKQQYAAGMKDRAQYETLYQPLEENLVKEFQSFDTPERRAERAGRAQASVAGAQEAQRNSAVARLQGYGIDPSQVQSAALDRNIRAGQAAQQAAAGNIERKNVEDTGRALRAEAINIGRGYPSQVAGSYGQTLQAGNSAIGNMNSTVGTGAGTMGTGLQWQQQGLAGTMQGANIRSMDYQNELAGYNAGMTPFEGLMGVAGIGASLYTGRKGFGAEGGEVPGDLSAIPSPEDKHPAMLAKGEFVLPREAVEFYGTDKIRKMVAKAREAQGIPAEGGAGPKPSGAKVEHPQFSRKVMPAIPASGRLSQLMTG